MQITEKEFKRLPVHLQQLFAKLPNPQRDEVVSLFPESQSCMSPSGADCEGTIFGGSRTQGNLPMDSGSAARFFYTAKADKSE